MASRPPKAHARMTAEKAHVSPARASVPDAGGFRSDAVITFQVHGLPIPQGSARSWVVNGKPVITSAAKGLATWRRLVADVAQRFAPTEPWLGPVGIELHFGIPKPKSAPKKRRVWPDKRPDLDKLCRAVFDALTYVVYADDSQVVEIAATKDYGPPGVVVEVRKIPDPDVPVS
ncbi:MAG TPA: RusA family crossover junction endodeoxyribonuclease [Thermoplasmata archaeon]|nr:RusA family crossover junction endodeoxyribonuclease [Thermoplasmata archaeon]